MTYSVTIEHTMDMAEGDIHWCDTELVEAESLEEARDKVLIDDIFDHLVDIRPQA